MPRIAVRFSVIIATRNAGRELERTLTSIVEQTHRDHEILVVDALSTDDTMDVVKRWASHLALAVSEPDSGIYDAWNKAIERVSGDWLVFLGAGDQLASPDVLERVQARLGALDAATGPLLAYGAVQLVSASRENRGVVGAPWSECRGPFFAAARMIQHQGVFHHRDLFKRHGLFDASYKIAGDYEMLLRELKPEDPRREPVYLEDTVVARMVLGGISTRFDSLPLFREAVRARARHGLKPGLGIVRKYVEVYGRRWLRRCFGEPLATATVRAYRGLMGRCRLV
jgi:glycosyltransferase involved in cell wall biosynthesis